jgi:hypothetical protein
MAGPDPGAGLRLTALPPATVVAVLQKAGSRHLDADGLAADLAARAPVNEDGTVNLLAYAAWLLKQLAVKEGGHA